MIHRNRTAVLLPSLLVFCVLAVSGAPMTAGAQETETYPPDPGVPQVFTIKAQYVRVAYNNEGYATLGYQLANQSVGDEWMLLEIGVALREKMSSQTLERNALSVSTPDEKKIPLATQDEFLDADLRALDARGKVIRDSINYFPSNVQTIDRLGFFTDINRGAALAHDTVELSPNRAALGRVYFKIPGGIQYGQHFLNIQFAETLIRVPFRILTKEEQKYASKEWKNIKKEIDARFGHK